MVTTTHKLNTGWFTFVRFPSENKMLHLGGTLYICRWLELHGHSIGLSVSRTRNIPWPATYSSCDASDEQKEPDRYISLPCLLVLFAARAGFHMRICSEFTGILSVWQNGLEAVDSVCAIVRSLMRRSTAGQINGFIAF
jgi:hypothetical protein